MKKAFGCLGIIVVTPLLLLLLFIVLLYTPPVQNYAVSKIAAYASEETGMTVSVGYVRLSFPLNLSLDDVLMVRPCSSSLVSDSLEATDTIADVGSLRASVALMPLLKLQVKLTELELEKVKMNTSTLVESMMIKGAFDRLAIIACPEGASVADIFLKEQIVNVDDVLLSRASINIAVPDSVPEDTTASEPFAWKINVHQLRVEDSDLTYCSQATTNNPQPTTISLKDINLCVDSFDMDSTQISLPKFWITIPNSRVNGSYRMDMDAFAEDAPGQFAASIVASVDKPLLMRFLSDALPEELTKSWPESNIDVAGCFSGNLQGIDFQDLSLSVPSMLSLHADGRVSNFMNPDSMSLRTHLKAETEDLSVVRSMLDAETRQTIHIPDVVALEGDVTLEGKRLFTTLALQQGGALVTADVRMTIPSTSSGAISTMAWDVKVDADNLNLRNYMPNGDIGIFSGSIVAKGNGFDIARNDIDAKVKVRRLQYGGRDLRDITLSGNLAHGLAGMTLTSKNRYLDADIIMHGNIARILNNTSDLDLAAASGDAHAIIRRADLYGLGIVDHPLIITGVTADAVAEGGMLTMDIDSRSTLLNGKISAQGVMNKNSLSATIVTDISHLDLQKMGFADEKFVTGMCGSADVMWNQSGEIHLQGIISDIAIEDTTGYFLPLDAEFDILSNRDTTYAHINATGATLALDASGGYEHWIAIFTRLASEIEDEIKNKELDQQQLKSLYPDLALKARVSKDAPLMYLVRSMDVDFKSLEADVNLRCGYGVNGYVNVDSVTAAGVTIDMASVAINSDRDRTGFKIFAQNSSQTTNNNLAFRAVLDGELLAKGAQVNARLYDAADKLGLQLGLKATVFDDSLLVTFTPLDPIIGYKEYHLNADNYLSLHKKNRVLANIHLVADDGTGFKLYSVENDDALQDVSLSVRSFDLTQLTALLPYFPKITGYLEGDSHFIMDEDKTITLASDLGVRSMTYEGCPLGDISSEFVLLPDLEKGRFVVDGNMKQNHEEIATISGQYLSDNASTEANEEMLDAKININRFPLDIANGFIPEQIIGFRGCADGMLSAVGPTDRLCVNGELYLDSAYMVSVPYGVALRFDNDPVRITDSKLMLENFSLYSENDNPIVVHGNIDFSNMENMTMDMKIRARDFQVISSKKSADALVYGNGYINLFATITGPLANLKMSGMLNLLAKSDLTYVLKDSPLNTDDRLTGLVTFVDFRDTTKVADERPPITGFNMDLRLKVDDGARLLCNLNADGSNYVNLEGGGELRMKYSPADDLTLTGRYTLNRGEMKYSLPVIPLKTFTIQDGSYVEFTGNMMNPRLNIIATEQTRAVVGNDNSDRRTVLFNVGVKVTKTLQDMGLQFTLEAPEDMEVQNELATMGEAQIGKLAVTMLTSGIYMSDTNTSHLTMNDALNSFLQGQISNIAGNALKTIDMSMGMTSVADKSGGTHTDYSFSFSKRLFNNRLSVSVGGRYSSASASSSSETALDNVSLEYRLNSSASKLLRLQYIRNKRDYIEGEMSVYSGTVMFKKKMDSLRELFRKVAYEKQKVTQTASK